MMSVLRQASLRLALHGFAGRAAMYQSQSVPVNRIPVDQIESDVLAIIGRLMWSWFATHEKQTLIQKRFLLFKVTVKVEDLRGLFVTLFGPEPTPAP